MFVALLSDPIMGMLFAPLSAKDSDVLRGPNIVDNMMLQAMRTQFSVNDPVIMYTEELFNKLKSCGAVPVKDMADFNNFFQSMHAISPTIDAGSLSQYVLQLIEDAISEIQHLYVTSHSETDLDQVIQLIINIILAKESLQKYFKISVREATKVSFTVCGEKMSSETNVLLEYRYNFNHFKEMVTIALSKNKAQQQTRKSQNLMYPIMPALHTASNLSTMEHPHASSATSEGELPTRQGTCRSRVLHDSDPTEAVRVSTSTDTATNSSVQSDVGRASTSTAMHSSQPLAMGQPPATHCRMSSAAGHATISSACHNSELPATRYSPTYISAHDSELSPKGHSCTSTVIQSHRCQRTSTSTPLKVPQIIGQCVSFADESAFESEDFKIVYHVSMHGSSRVIINRTHIAKSTLELMKGPCEMPPAEKLSPSYMTFMNIDVKNEPLKCFYALYLAFSCLIKVAKDKIHL
ncbi:uncharacterized protein [Ptychodera flava]